MSSQRNTGAFILGGVIGGIVGAAVTLWNTPKSGDELRAMVSAHSPDSSEDVRTTTPASAGRFSNPVLSFVEKATAPIVGVELGKLAKNDPDATQYRPVRASAADARPPSHGDEHLPHEQVDVDHQHVASTDELTSPPPRTTSTVESGQEPGIKPASHGNEHLSHDEVDFEDQRVATIEELTSPPPETAQTVREDEESNQQREPSPFPDLEHKDRT